MIFRINWVRDGLRDDTVKVNPESGWLHNIAREAYVVVPDGFEESGTAMLRRRLGALWGAGGEEKPGGSIGAGKRAACHGSVGTHVDGHR